MYISVFSVINTLVEALLSKVLPWKHRHACRFLYDRMSEKYLKMYVFGLVYEDISKSIQKKAMS